MPLQKTKIIKEGIIMLRLALMFFIVAIIAGLFGFGGIAAASAEIAQFIFFIFVALLVTALVFGAIDGRSDP
tara:strand:- start:656 stop:871 length:216 start_codon:yes stop_codon:yes gene_type:complete